jgi:hypothetical protein
MVLATASRWRSAQSQHRLSQVAPLSSEIHEMWNRFDKALIPVLLAEDIRFRGSL